MWPTEYMELKHINELLVCRICYEYMDTSLMTSCSHNYCSLCIRKYLSYKTQCPTCSEETFENDLRKNKILDEIITYFLIIKKKLKKKSYEEKIEIIDRNRDENKEVIFFKNDSDQQKEIDLFDTNNISPETSTTPRTLQNTLLESSIPTVNISTPHRQRDCQQDISSPSISPRIPAMFTPKRKSFRKKEDCRTVMCPVCKVDVPQNNVNKHLDDCLKRENIKEQPTRTELKRKPLPKLVLSLMNVRMIQKRLKELGLSSQGDRKTLEKRLQKYTIFYNAECDKINPRPISELIKLYEEEENIEKKLSKPSNRLNINKNTEHNIIERERKKYLAANKNNFDQLVAEIKSADSQKLPVKYNILKTENIEDLHEDRVLENSSTSGKREENNIPFMNSINAYIDNSNSNEYYPLQTYSSEDPMNFLMTELSSSSGDNTNQISPKIDLVSSNSIADMENLKSKGSSAFENISTHEEIASNNLPGGMRFSQDRVIINTKESAFELIRNEPKCRKEIKFCQRNKDDTCRKQGNSEDRNIWKKELCNEATDLITEEIGNDIADSDNNEILDCGKSQHAELCNMKEKYPSNHTRLKEENLGLLGKDIYDYTLQKPKYEVISILSDEEKNEDNSTNIRKLVKFNNENFNEKTSQDKGKLESKRKSVKRLFTTHVKNKNRPMKKFVREKN